MWIHNLELKESKRIKKDDFPSWEQQGWLKGRKMKFTKELKKIKVKKCAKCGEYKCKRPNVCNKHQRINTFIKIFNFKNYNL